MPEISSLRLLVCAGLVAFAAACDRPARRADETDLGPIAIGAHVTVRTDTVGHDRWETRATFALVDADNPHDQPRLVTLGGVLVDGDGRETSKLRAETLIIPARGRRTFALVDERQVVRETATGANIDVRGVRRPVGTESVAITEGHVWNDHGKVVATGMVVNLTKRACIAMVFAGFHGPGGMPMTRPFAVFELGAEAQRPTRFVGPPGSTAGYIFLGDIRC